MTMTHDLPKDPTGGLLRGTLRGHYRRFLLPSLGGAAATSIYSFVDTVAVGQGVGPAGAAAAAVLLPSFGVVAFLGTAFGVGGAVLLGRARGAGREREARGWFSASLAAVVGLTVAATLLTLAAGDAVWRLCGSDDALLPLVRAYGVWVVASWTFTALSMHLACMIRNDGAPGHVLAAIVAGGLLNVFGDWLLVFPLRMGMAGAAIATVAGAVLQTAVLLAYFLRGRCALRWAPPRLWPRRAVGRTLAAGFSAGVPSVACVLLTTLLNHQAIRHGGAAALAVFGVAMCLSVFFQQLFGGVGQALQPLVSVSLGAGARARLRRAFRLAMRDAALFGLLCTLPGALFPETVVRVFMEGTPEVLAVAPGILRGVSLGFLPMSLTILAGYHLQALMRTGLASALALSRGLALSGGLMLLLPPLMGLRGVWWALTLAEYVTAVLAALALLWLRGRECPGLRQN